MHHTTATPEMRDLIVDLGKAHRGFWRSAILGERLEIRVLGFEGGIPELRKRIKEKEAIVAKYKKALRACEKQLELEAAEVLGIPDLPNRIKQRLVRMGCRTRMDVHLTTIWKHENPGWGRKSEDVFNEWKDKRFDEDYAQEKLKRGDEDL